MAGFFDKVVVGLNKGVNSVSEGSKLIVEKAKLNTQIQDTEKEKVGLMQNLGVLVYNLHASGEINIEQCAGLCGEISNCNLKIRDLQTQLQNLESARAAAPVGAVTCECGHANKEGAKFCAGCGKGLM